MGLLAGRPGDAVHVTPQDAAGPLDHGVADVDDGAAGLRAHVRPGVRVGGVEVGVGGQDLQAAGDVEEQGDAADVGVADEAGLPIVKGLGRVAQQADGGAGSLGGRL